MVGLPGSGKTFFAAQFAKAFGSPFIDINELSGYCQDDAAAAVVGKTFLQEIAKTKQPFIYEGDSNTRARRSEFVRWARSEGYRPVIIWVQTDVTTARSRSVKNQRLSREAFDYYVRRFSEPNAGELYFVISGKHPYSSQSHAALTFLKQIDQQTEDEALPSKAPATAPPAAKQRTQVPPPAPTSHPVRAMSSSAPRRGQIRSTRTRYIVQ